MKAIVIGASGLAGAYVVRRLEREDIDVTGTYRTSPTDEATVQLDKTDKQAVSSVINDRNPDFVVDAAAFHDVDACEAQREESYSVNATGTWNAAVAADDIGAQFIYFSTDYVFRGDPKQAPYVESDPVNPINYYAQSKYAGEQAAKVAAQWTILRSSVLYGTSSQDFVTWVLTQLRDGPTVDVVNDQTNSPTWAVDLAEACSHIGRHKITGLFHAAGPKSISRYEFAKRIADAYGFGSKCINPISTDELGQRAPRPRDSSLDSSKLYEITGQTFHDPVKALKHMSS